MAKTFMQMAQEAMGEVPAVSPSEARRRLREDPNTLLIDVRDLADRRRSGMAAGAIPVSAGMLSVRADQELPEAFRDPRLQDRSRPIITACELGPLSAISAKTLKEIGFTNVAYLEGGTQGWIQAGLPTEAPQDT